MQDNKKKLIISVVAVVTAILLTISGVVVYNAVNDTSDFEEFMQREYLYCDPVYIYGDDVTEYHAYCDDVFSELKQLDPDIVEDEENYTSYGTYMNDDVIYEIVYIKDSEVLLLVEEDDDEPEYKETQRQLWIYSYNPIEFVESIKNDSRGYTCTVKIGGQIEDVKTKECEKLMETVVEMHEKPLIDFDIDIRWPGGINYSVEGILEKYSTEYKVEVSQGYHNSYAQYYKEIVISNLGYELEIKTDLKS